MDTKINKNCVLNIKSNRLMSFLSLSTMTLLILASVVIITIIKVTPIVILSLGQLKQGQRDLILRPRLQYLNSTKLSQICGLPVMPRLAFQLVINQKQNVKGWLMDFTLQRKQHLGTLGGHQGTNHEFVYAYEGLGLFPHSSIDVQLYNSTLLADILIIITQQPDFSTKEQVLQELRYLIDEDVPLRGRFTVKQTFKTASGKFGVGTVSDFVYLDIRYAFQQMIRQTYRILKKSQAQSKLISFLTSPAFNLSDFASEATINIPNRIQVYSNPNNQEVYKDLYQFAEKILGQVGMFALSTEMSIAMNMVSLGYVGMFLGVVLKLIVITLFILSVIMMNNMLTMGIERKQFDFAVLKVMGADKPFIVMNILISSLRYVGFANVIAFPLSYAALEAITLVFEQFFGYRYEIKPSAQGIAGGLMIGLLVPVISSILPIRGVIRNDLVQNLNPVRNKTAAVKAEVYVEDREFPTGKLIFGLIATGYGLMIYYLLPKSLINQNIGLMLSIFFVLLEGLMVGLIILSYSIQYVSEQITARIALFWVDKTDLLLTLKNLANHRFKNRRSSIIYTLSVSFMVFVSSSVQLQLQTMYYEMFRFQGSSYIEIRGNTIRPDYFNRVLAEVQGVSDWSYMTWGLTSYMESHNNISDILISDKARLFFAQNQIYGISPNQINTLFYDKVSVYKTDAKPPYDPYSFLYSQQGFMTCTISKYIANKFGILNGPNHELYINFYREDSVRRIAMNYSSVFDKKVGLFYSSIIQYSQVGISFETYRVLAGIPSFQEVPIRYVKVQLSDPAQASSVARKIRQKIDMSEIDWVWDYSELKGNIDKIEQLLNKAFFIMFIIVLTISFFSLVTTTYVNIINQTNQIAIMMVLGLQKRRIVKIYVYESFIVVLNSCIIGAIVGYAIVWMCGLQIELFSDILAQIHISGVPIIIAAAVISSFLSTYQPLSEIFGSTISEIMNYSK